MKQRCAVAMSNSFGFGGHNVSLIVKEFLGWTNYGRGGTDNLFARKIRKFVEAPVRRGHREGGSVAVTQAALQTLPFRFAGSCRQTIAPPCSCSAA